MADVDINTILIKRSSLTGVIPALSSLELGELGINTADGKLFIKTISSSLSSIKQFLNSDDQYFTFDKNLSAVNTQFGNNTISQVFGSVLGGYSNDVSGGGSTVVNGEDNDIAGDFSIIGSGLNNKISLSGDYSFIAGGKNNLISHSNVFTLGSNLTSHSDNFTYVNNLSSSGFLYGDGSNITNVIATGVVGSDTEVRSLSSNWQSTYTTVLNNSSSWIGGSGSDVSGLSANWDTAYAYVSANSVNLTATNIFVTNDLTVTDTVSAKYYQGTLIDWMTLVRGTKTTPTLLATIGTGDVYTYVYSTATTDKTYYRYIATDGSEDSFYGNFTNPTLSNLIATKKIIL